MATGDTEALWECQECGWREASPEEPPACEWCDGGEYLKIGARE